jgi:hypothetical protein
MLEDDDDSSLNGAVVRMGGGACAGQNPRAPAVVVVAFDRRELSEILSLYGRMVARGEWRDYAIDFTPHRAIFSIFRRTSETPLFRVVKEPRAGRRQGAYSVVAPSGLVLKRGHDLRRVLGAMEPKPRLMLV